MTELSTHVFELDLTSVCVSTGVVQLPMKMQPFFTDGWIEATVDGEAVSLEFAGPRRLGGFKRHFEQRALSANDRVRFELDVADGKVTGLNASCVKRERSKPALMPKPAGGPAASSGDGAVGERGPGQTEAAGRAGESSGWLSTDTVRAVRRVTIVGSDAPPPRYESAGPTIGTPQAVAASAAREQAAPNSRWRALDGLTPGGPLTEPDEADYRDTVVRAIRRRRTDVPTAPLTEEVTATRASAETEAHVGERPASTDPSTRHAPGYEPQRMRLADLVAPAEPSPTPRQEKRPAAARSRIFAVRGPRVEHDARGFATLAPSSAQPAGASKPNPGPELIEERELVPVARPAAKAANVETATPHGVGGKGSGSPAAMFDPGSSPSLPDSHGRNGSAGFVGPGAPALRETPSVPEKRVTDNTPRMLIDDADFGRPFGAGAEAGSRAGVRAVDGAAGRDTAPAVDDRFERQSERRIDADDMAFERALRAGEILDKRTQPLGDRRPNAETSQRPDVTQGEAAERAAAQGAAAQGAAAQGAAALGAQAARAVRGANAALDGAVTPAVTGDPGHDLVSVEDAVKRVSDYLERPGTPAIVRSDLIAVELGLDAHRCELALERLSENRERISRIRKGAYMIRRDATRRDEAHL